MVGGSIGGAVAAAGALVSGLTGGMTGVQSMKKLTIRPLPPSQLPEISVPFNPTSYSLTKTVNWTPPHTRTDTVTEAQRGYNAPPLESGGGESRVLAMELFFDVTENPDVRDVRIQTNQVARLAMIERDSGHPPVCELRWGSPIGSTDFPFKGVITNLVQTFTLFTSNGEPVQAKLNVTFREYIDPTDDKRETDPELTTRIVKRGDTLSSIAAEVYNNPKLWRVIADANHLDNPLDLKPGTSLSIRELR